MATRVRIRRLLVWAIATSYAAGGGFAASFEELVNAAATARRANQIPEAIELYRQAVAQRPDWEEGWWFVGTLSYSLFRHADCENAFTHFVELDDKREMAWTILGLSEFENGHYDSSRAHLQRGLATGGKLAPELEAGARFHYGLLLTKSGLFDPGMRELARFAGQAATEPLALAGIGLNGLRMPLLPSEIPPEKGDLVEKAGKATAAWLIHPEAVGAEIAATTVGDAGEAEKQFRALEDLFHDLLQSYPKAPGVHFLYGTYLTSSRPEQGQAEFRRELEVNPGNADALAMTVLAQLTHGSLAAALASAKKAESEKASDPLVEYAYGKALVAAGSISAGIDRLKIAESLDPDGLAYHTALAGAYSKAGRYEEAREERRTALTMAEGSVAPN
jgi:tetratricopeptide (TPR) repeat protein